MTRKIIFLTLLFLAAMGAKRAYTVDQILEAIQWVESGDAGDRAEAGDGGEAKGPMQIHYACWLDSGVPGKWEDCQSTAYSWRVSAGIHGAVRAGRVGSG